MTAGLDHLKHMVVLMMENRSSDHMLGGLKKQDPRINGLTGSESNLDTTNEPVKVQPKAQFQGQLDPDPDHHFPGVHQQLYFGTPGPPAAPSMNGFIQSYFQQQKDAGHARKIIYYFPPEKLLVLSTQIFLLYSWGGGEGTHLTANMNTSLLGGAARPSLF